VFFKKQILGKSHSSVGLGRWIINSVRWVSQRTLIAHRCQSHWPPSRTHRSFDYRKQKRQRKTKKNRRSLWLLVREWFYAIRSSPLSFFNKRRTVQQNIPSWLHRLRNRSDSRLVLHFERHFNRNQEQSSLQEFDSKWISPDWRWQENVKETQELSWSNRSV